MKNKKCSFLAKQKGFHSFCSNCLKSCYKNPLSIECPICRQVNEVRYNDVPKNRDILQFIEYLRENKSNEATTSSGNYDLMSFPEGAATSNNNNPAAFAGGQFPHVMPSAPVLQIPVNYERTDDFNSTAASNTTAV
jgi:hypothetical protein